MPAILRTYLGRVQCAAGREFVRVVAVVHRRDGTQRAILEPEEWLSWTDPERGTSPAGVWETHFSGWAHPNDSAARQAAVAAFAESPAAEFLAQHHTSLAAEKEELTRWLRTRAEELCGPRTGQAALFGPRDATLPAWQILTDDSERLAAFAIDPAVKPRARTRGARRARPPPSSHRRGRAPLCGDARRSGPARPADARAPLRRGGHAWLNSPTSAS